MSVIMQLKMIIYSVIVVLGVAILIILYMIFKLGEIADNLHASFIMFSEDLVDLADVLRSYHDRLDY